MRLVRSLTARLVLGHLAVATLTGVTLTLALVVVYVVAERRHGAEQFVWAARSTVLPWLFGDTEALGAPRDPPGYVLVVAPDGRVAYAAGDTPCAHGATLAACAPDLQTLGEGRRFFDDGGRRWLEIVETTITGERVINRRYDVGSSPSLTLPGFQTSGWAEFALVAVLGMGVLSLPVALPLALLLARPLGRRLARIAAASRRFAAGDLDARVGDVGHDEIGVLARQFDDMAGALQQNVALLRDLAQRNAALARETEAAAVRAERARISRDLHDAIAQRLFSLSASTATLPDLIAQDPARGAERARAVAALAETALLELRGLLVELRPSGLVEQGFAEALGALCREWEADDRPVHLALALTGRRLPAAVEDALYRVAQEALSNATRHAAAHAVHVSVVEGQRRATLSVTDDGRGFGPARAGAGFGLVGMRERVRSLGGDLWIESEPGRGTSVRAEVPLTTTAEHERNSAGGTRRHPLAEGAR